MFINKPLNRKRTTAFCSGHAGTNSSRLIRTGIATNECNTIV